MFCSDRKQVEFITEPSRYRHWRVSYQEKIAHVQMDVNPDAPLYPGYELKLNSYDLGVDIELADIVRRMRFEHPEIRVVMISSANEAVFCAGANIHMLGASSHAWKVNFCKFTNETRCELEDAGEESQQIYIAACNGTTAGGGYELALACQEIYLQDDGKSAVSLPEVPLLGVLPGTGGLTRLVDKRKVRRDRADIFATTAEGIRGKKALEWNLVDGIFPRSKFQQAVMARAEQLATQVDVTCTGERKGISLTSITPQCSDQERVYKHVKLQWDSHTRIAQLRVQAPSAADTELLQKGTAAMLAVGDQLWALRAFRELDDALLHIRLNLPEIGLVLVRTHGDSNQVLAHDQALWALRDHWFANEIIQHMKRVLCRFDLTSRSFFAFADTGTAFAGCLFELALAADRFYALDEPDQPIWLGLSPFNHGPFSMSHGLSRLYVHLYGQETEFQSLMNTHRLFTTAEADEMGLVTALIDSIDWEDDTRVAIEERASLSPDALTGMEANLRFPGPETGRSKIFARLTAWQNWIFIRPNATGPKGALHLYGKPERPEFDWTRV